MRSVMDGNHEPEDRQLFAGDSTVSGRQRVGCVIVTYRPHHEPLLRQLAAIHTQVGFIVLVDNGDGLLLPTFPEEYGLEVICLGANDGIARAQNVGIQRLCDRGATHILLLDQDSLPAADMVACLLEGLTQLQQAGIAVAAVGPQYSDPRQGAHSPFVYREGLALKERSPHEPHSSAVSADFLIASGCLIPVAVLGAVGAMDESLFIDYVDIEWGLRAQHLGYSSYGIPAAQMEHSLGDDWIVHRGRRFPVHSPLRHYYYTRNSILLARRPWIGWPWRFILLRRMAKQLVFFSVFVPGKRLENAWMMTCGVLHGVLGRSGKL
ncbi:glycosyltransferase family 2 protein [Rhizobium sp. L80/93]|uniref:glycosyltransferase family 2 protein n=1 Tax=Rhizobium sp. E27B/91 TaxID=2819995 RepID=UPI001FFDFA20|nr:glycosyltransferase family 2 protein [Rhizobium sp. E27B/91]